MADLVVSFFLNLGVSPGTDDRRALAAQVG